MSHDTQWAKARARARQNRHDFTDTLKGHGVTGNGYMRCTDVVYSEIFGARAYQIRISKGLPSKANLRDHLDGLELSAIMLAEALAAKKIEAEMLLGNAACLDVAAVCARHVAHLINQIAK